MYCAKVKLGDDFRRIRLESGSLDAFKKTLQSVYNQGLPKSYSITYVDEDKDTITVSSQTEFNEALRFFGDEIIRLTIVPVEYVETSQPIGDSVQEPTREEPINNNENAEPAKKDLGEELGQWITNQLATVQQALGDVVSENNRKQISEKITSIQTAIGQVTSDERLADAKKSLENVGDRMQRGFSEFNEQVHLTETLSSIPSRVEASAAQFPFSERRQQLQELWNNFEKQLITSFDSVVTDDRKELLSKFFTEANDSIYSFFRGLFNAVYPVNPTPVPPTPSETVPIPNRVDPFSYEEQLNAIKEMGFTDVVRIQQLLIEHSGNVAATLEELLLF